MANDKGANGSGGRRLTPIKCAGFSGALGLVRACRRRALPVFTTRMMACVFLAFTHKCGMADVDQLAKDLKAQLRLYEDILAIVEKENVALKQTDSNAEAAQARKEVLPDLEASLESLKKHRERWVKLPEPTRAKYPEIAGLLRQNQDVIMKIIVLDRENEQTLLRKGLVPPKHLPSAKRNQPHYVADLYRRGGGSGKPENE